MGIKTTVFKVGEFEYRLNGTIDVFKQFQIVKILTPVLTRANAIAARENDKGGIAFMEAIAGLSEEDTKFIFNLVLSRVQRKIDKAWTDIYTEGGGLQYEDIDLFDTLNITGEVLKSVLEPFFTKLTQANFLGEPS